MTRLFFLFTFIATTLLVASTAEAQSKLIPFQARLTDPSGTPVANGVYPITFSVYDAETGGAAIWSEPHPSISVIDGRINVILGAMVSIDDPQGNGSQPPIDFTADKFLGITVGGGGEMVPRHQLIPSFHSRTADFADMANSVPDASINSMMIQDGAVTGDDISDATITAQDLAAGAVEAGSIAADSVDGSKIADGSLTGADIADLTADDLLDEPGLGVDFPSATLRPLLNSGYIAVDLVSLTLPANGSVLVLASGLIQNAASSGPDPTAVCDIEPVPGTGDSGAQVWKLPSGGGRTSQFQSRFLQSTCRSSHILSELQGNSRRYQFFTMVCQGYQPNTYILSNDVLTNKYEQEHVRPSVAFFRSDMITCEYDNC